MLSDLWYKNAVFYSLNVETFMDGDGDGCGDFEGLARRLDYIESLGIDALWLAPFQPSPLRDDGYDIADYYNVASRLGSSGDFVEFMRQAESRGLPIHILKSNSVSQVRDALSRIYGVDKQDEATTRAMAEAAAAIRQVKATLRPVEISPQNAYLRRLQHQLVAENDLSARSTGKEPQRRLRITPSPEDPVT